MANRYRTALEALSPALRRLNAAETPEEIADRAAFIDACSRVVTRAADYGISTGKPDGEPPPVGPDGFNVRPAD